MNIAFIGKTRSGKDTAYGLLAKKGYYVQRVAFGDALKEEFYKLFPQFIGQPKPTKHLIFFGQSMRRIDANIWVRKTLENLAVDERFYEQANLQVPTLVFTDIRQLNEYQTAKEMGTIFIRLKVSDETRKARMTALGEEVTDEVLEAHTEQLQEAFACEFTISSDTEEILSDELDIVLDILDGRA